MSSHPKFWQSHKQIIKDSLAVAFFIPVAVAAGLGIGRIVDNAKAREVEIAKKCAAGTAFLAATVKPAIDAQLNQGNLRFVELNTALRDNTPCTLKFEK